MRRFVERSLLASLALWLASGWVVFGSAQARRRKINRPAAAWRQPQKSIGRCSASFKTPKPKVNLSPARTEKGHLISDCDPVVLKTAYQPRLSYPKLAQAAKASGVVEVEAVVDEDGRVIWAKVVKGRPLLRAEALRAACATRMEPAVDCIGRRRRVNTILYFTFKPEKSERARL